MTTLSSRKHVKRQGIISNLDFFQGSLSLMRILVHAITVWAQIQVLEDHGCVRIVTLV